MYRVEGPREGWVTELRASGDDLEVSFSMVVRLKGAKANGMTVDEAFRRARAAYRAEERERCDPA